MADQLGLNSQPLLDDESDVESRRDSEGQYSLRGSYDDGAAPRRAATGTTLTAFFTLVNGLVGGGLLALPAGFKYAGISAAVVSIIILGSASALTLKALVWVKTAFPKGMINKYEDAGEVLFGARGRKLTTACIMGSQLGFASAYFVFITDNFFRIAAGEDHPKHFVIPYPVGVMFVWIFASGLALIRDMSVRGYCSGFAVLLLLMSMTMLVYNGFKDGEPLKSPFDPQYGPQFNPGQYPSFFGIAAFAFCCHGLVFAVEESIRDPPGVVSDVERRQGRMKQWDKAVNAAIFTSGLVYALIGALGYMFFYKTVSPAISNDLPKTPAGFSVSIGLSLMCLICAPLQMVPVMVAVEDAMETKQWLGPDQGIGYWHRNGLRCLIMLAPASISLVVPCFGQVTALVGGVFTSLMGFVLPPIFYMRSHRQSITPLMKALMYGVMMIGIAGLVSVVVLTIIQFANGQCSN